MKRTTYKTTLTEHVLSIIALAFFSGLVAACFLMQPEDFDAISRWWSK